MPPFFTLRQVVSQIHAGPEDVVGVKRALNRMGFYDVPDYGMTPYADRTMFDGIRGIIILALSLVTDHAYWKYDR